MLLALLSRTAEALPSAALRDAVEALFRAVCHQLTPTGGPQLLSLQPVYHHGCNTVGDAAMQ